MSSQNTKKNTQDLIDRETQNLLQIIKLRELYRYKNVLVHYRYDFTPKQECSIAELSWGFVKDPWFADAVATNVERYLPDIRDEPPVFVQEWNNIETEEKKVNEQHATMEITQETTTISNDDLPPPLVEITWQLCSNELKTNNSPECDDAVWKRVNVVEFNNTYDDLPPLETWTSEGHSDNDDNESDDSSWDTSSSDDSSFDDESDEEKNLEPLVRSVSFNSLMKELDEIVIDVNWEQSKTHLSEQTDVKDCDVKDYEAEMEKIYTQYLLSKYASEKFTSEARKQLKESIDELHKTAEEASLNVKVEKYNVAENMNTYELIHVEQPTEQIAMYEYVKMPTPQRAILNPMSDDEVFVRVFTVQDLKWNGGADLVDPMKLPTNQCFKMKKTASWEESVWEEIGYRTNIFEKSPINVWTPFVFSKRANGTIRPSFVMEEYVPLSVYQKNLNVRNEVWILLLNTREPTENEVILHKKWYQKGWFYYQGFELVEKSTLLSSIMNYDIAFEEVCAVGDRNKMRVDTLNPSSSIKSLGLSNGDIVISTKMSHYLGPRGTPELINNDCIADAFDMIENVRPQLKNGKFKLD